MSEPEDLQFSKKQRKKYSELYAEWYGADASSAIAGHLPKPKKISDLLDSVTKKMIPPWQRSLELVTMKWTEIVGDVSARRLIPVRIENGVLFLELQHPAYRMAFDNAAMKKAVIGKVNDVAGSEICREIRFVAGGMFAPTKKKQEKV